MDYIIIAVRATLAIAAFMAYMGTMIAGYTTAL